MMLEATDGRLFYAPLGDNPQKIADLGTGTGLWAIESASCRLIRFRMLRLITYLQWATSTPAPRFWVLI